ncbi:mitochondrial import inner membrane translocase subunit Tim8 [Belonocnema kinseyi]|uniref:mitochondrial import inner membrane translocase subunit Tim8 n=1 Tax=Belonocnema kinseyi TaxID=2817044 RepID=UPI00143DDE03|nr:mitochondrial import inner membrane translocase subunit Tim8 [Belonocnema kinseyi]
MTEAYGTGSTIYDETEKSKVGDNELAEMLEIEKQKMQFNEQMHEFNSICWDTCVDRPSTKLDGKTEKCLKNCVDRFIDVSLFITNRYAQMLQKNL